MIGLWFLPSALPLIHIYVCTKFNFKPFITFQDMARTSNHMKNKWLRGDNMYQYTGQDYGSCALHFLSLPYIYKPCFTSIPFLLNKIWAGQATTMKTWLWGNNSVNIQERIIVLVHCPFSHCHISINQVSFQYLLYFPRYGPDRHPL